MEFESDSSCTQDEENLTPLQQAAKDGDKEEVRKLLSTLRADYEQCQEPYLLHCHSEMYPIVYAIHYNHLDIAQLILDNSAKILEVIKPWHKWYYDDEVSNGLNIAIRCKNIEAVKMMLDAGVRSNCTYSPTSALQELLDFRRRVFENVLHCPERKTEDFLVECLKLLLAAGADVNRGRFAKPLSIACKIAHPVVIRELLRHGAQPNQNVLLHTFGHMNYNHVMSEIERMIMKTSEEKAKECLDVFIDELGVDFKLKMKFDKNPPITYEASMVYAAIKHAKVHLVKHLFDRGASLKPPVCKNGREPAPLAVAFESVVDVQDRDSKWKEELEDCYDTSLLTEQYYEGQILKSAEGAQKVVELLVKRGEDLNKLYTFAGNFDPDIMISIQYKDLTPLEYCMVTESRFDLQVLLKLGANIFAETTHHFCLSHAVTSASPRRLEILELLLNHGLDPNMNVYWAAGTALHMSFRRSDCASRRHGQVRDIHLMDRSRFLVENPFDTSQGCYTSRAVKLLLKYGASASFKTTKELVKTMLNGSGRSGKPEKLRRIALCCLTKIRAVYAAGLMKRSTYIYAINFYLCRFNLKEFIDWQPQSLQDSSQKAVLRHLRKRDQATFAALELPMTMKNTMCFTSPLKGVWEEKELIPFLHSFSNEKSEVEFEEDGWGDLDSDSMGDDDSGDDGNGD